MKRESKLFVPFWMLAAALDGLGLELDTIELDDAIRILLSDVSFVGQVTLLTI